MHCLETTYVETRLYLSDKSRSPAVAVRISLNASAACSDDGGNEKGEVLLAIAELRSKIRDQLRSSEAIHTHLVSPNSDTDIQFARSYLRKVFVCMLLCIMVMSLDMQPAHQSGWYGSAENLKRNAEASGGRLLWTQLWH